MQQCNGPQFMDWKKLQVISFFYQNKYKLFADYIYCVTKKIKTQKNKKKHEGTDKGEPALVTTGKYSIKVGRK